MRPNYFIFMGYLRKMRLTQQSEPPPLDVYEPPFKKSLIRPWYGKILIFPLFFYQMPKYIINVLIMQAVLVLDASVVSRRINFLSI